MRAMPIPCPTCLISNPDQTASCLHCGKPLGAQDAAAAMIQAPSADLRLPMIDSAQAAPAADRSEKDSTSSVGRTALGRISQHDFALPPEVIDMNIDASVDTPPEDTAPDAKTVQETPLPKVVATVQSLGHRPEDETLEGESIFGSRTSPKPVTVFSPRLVVIRGERPNVEYPILAGKNYLGRTSDKPVDIDLECQEPIERIWTSRQHAVISLEAGVMVIEDLNSLNGTFINRTRIHPAQQRVLNPGDILQVGTVQLKVIV
jgi:hypothetical protein